MGIFLRFELRGLPEHYNSRGYRELISFKIRKRVIEGFILAKLNLKCLLDV